MAFDPRAATTTGAVNTVTHRFGRDILEYDGTSGAILRWYAYGSGMDPLNRMNLAGATRDTLIPDVQGSIIATLDAASGGQIGK